jgi:hypothetical protein
MDMKKTVLIYSAIFIALFIALAQFANLTAPKRREQTPEPTTAPVISFYSETKSIFDKLKEEQESRAKASASTEKVDNGEPDNTYFTLN